MTVLIVGGSGFLGAELVRQAVTAGHTTAATFTRMPDSAPGISWHALDLRDPDRLEAVMAKVRPRVIVNATNGGADWAVTAEGPVRLAMAAARRGSRLVHVSSDAVFSGARVHYDESCLPDPLTPYGAAKAAAETGVRLLSPNAVIARTSLIIGDLRSEHVRAVHDLAAGARSGALFTDDIRCPVHVTDLAAALLELADTGAPGVHHLSGVDAVNRHELGVLIARRDGLDSTRIPAGLRANSGLPGALDVRLDNRDTQSRLRTTLRGARQFLAQET
ncbi:SDR family oxidoreductase [Streptacidiphilus anmyonensis]|uniref:SDR family oxidoreductase n=1 Tax=Streptacidiphilus anmyonensis TaxID=405782 RepID=UPI0005AB9074|nr:sugar nucleotide-binding protein [Streptacidiphilus anmyonensis]